MTEHPCTTCDSDDDVAGDGPAPIANPAGQGALAWRAAPHGAALSRMRGYLAGAQHPLPIRSIAQQDDADPAVALLDAWAVVTDVVSFYTERIAQEGFLRTSTERDSVRQLARTLGYELRPGVAAAVELAIEVETAAGAPAAIEVPVGMPVQTVPAPGALPQTFETSDAIEARGVWNSIAAADRVAQQLPFDSDEIWLDTATSGVVVNDMVLVVGAERRGVTPTQPHGDDHEMWDLRRIVAVTANPPHAPGWSVLTLDRALGFRSARPLVAVDQIEVHHLTRRLNLFGWSAPDQALLDTRHAGQWSDWQIDESMRMLEADGDVPELAAGSWVVLDQPGRTEAYRIVSVTPSGAKKFGISGKVTLAEVDIGHNLGEFDRNTALVHAVSRMLPASMRPRPDLVGAGADGTEGRTLEVAAVAPPLPVGRLVLVSGVTDDGTVTVEATTVTATTAAADDTATAAAASATTADATTGTVTLTLDPPLTHRYHAATVRVRGNAVLATHGETVTQVLGSGDGRRTFASFALRRAPLTYVRTTTSADGALPESEVRVDGVAWSAIGSLDDAGPADQVYVVRQAEDGETTIVFGDGIHGARLPTGTENVTATYRVGIGANGAAEPGQVRLPVRKPRGMASVGNPLPSRDWAPAEGLEEARVNAPQRIRTLDRAVSVEDYGDFARGYSGVGRARADLVWNGRVDTVVLSVLDAVGQPASDVLVRDLRGTIDDRREQRAPRTVLAGEVVEVGMTLDLTIDPAYEIDDVVAAVRAALLVAFGGLDFAAPLAASSALVVATGVPGVRSSTMPVLSAPATVAGTVDLIRAHTARWAAPAATTTTAPTLLPAQALRLDDTLLFVGVIP